jgi:threonine dehydrogenase-like Zn-dependent dehydrogenase
MWSAYFDTNPARVVSTRALGAVSRRAYYGALAPLRVRQLGRVSLPEYRWVRVQNTVAGISDDDLRLVHLNSDPRVSPMAAPRSSRVFLGREVVGEVVEVGPEVEFLRVGDRVSYQLDKCCSTQDIEPPCHHCATGNYSLCENRYLPGAEQVGGGWGDQMVVHERQLFLVPDNLSDEQAALLEPTARALHAVLRAQPQPGAQVLVIGAATTGLLVVQALRALNPNATITAMPAHPFQLELATLSGATRILYTEDSTPGVARLTGAKHFKGSLGSELLVGGFDLVFDTLGTAATLQNGLRWVREGGTVVLVGREPRRMQIDLTPVWHREITLVGTLDHGTENWPGGIGPATWGVEGGRASSFALAAALIRDRRMLPDRLITHRFPLSEVRRAVATAEDYVLHRAVKVVLDARHTVEPEVPTVEALMQEVHE